MGDGLGYALRPPNDHVFYRVLACIMTAYALGDRTWWGMEPYNIFYVCNRFLAIYGTPAVLISQIIYLFIHFSELSFTVLGIMFSIIVVTFLVNAIRMSADFKLYEKVMKDFMNKIHLFNYKDQSEFAMMTLIKVEKYIRWTFFYLLAFLMTDWIAWTAVTCMQNSKNWDAIQNKTMQYQSIIYLTLPFPYETNFYCWLILHCVNCYIVGSACIMTVIFNTINYAFIYNLVGHIQILKYDIKTLALDDCSDEEVKKKLIDVIKYHSFVMRIFRDVEGAFGLNVAAHYLYNLAADSLMLYQIMIGDTGNKMVYGLMIGVYVGGLILLSFILEEIRRQSDDLPVLVYSLPWQDMAISNQKMILLFLLRVQPELEFMGSGGLKTGVQPMISILKSTFSYYVMLKSSLKT